MAFEELDRPSTKRGAARDLFRQILKESTGEDPVGFGRNFGDLPNSPGLTRAEILARLKDEKQSE